MVEQKKEAEEKHEKEEDEFRIKELMHLRSETNRRIEEAYDEKIKRLEAKKKLLPNEEDEEKHEARITTLKEKLNEVKNRISEARKAGKDPFIADLWIRNVNAKIRIANITHEKKDYEKVENILNKAELELEEALKQEDVDVKKEIEDKLRRLLAKETGKSVEELKV